ncbi:MAG: sulfite exporter TauE/SafE family protein [Thioalkalivibrio sp.]
MSFELAVLITGAFVAALASGASGFAFGLVGLAIWLHALDPSRAVPLVVICSMLLNMAMIWRLWGSVNLRRLSPFLVGAVFGVPLGVAALTWVDPVMLRQGVGVLLVLYSIYMLTLTRLPVINPSPMNALAADTGFGALGGFMGGSTGLNGVFPTLWSTLRGWNKSEQRGVFQPYILLVHTYTLMWFGGAGTMGRQTLIDLAWAMPFVVAGGYIGLQLFNRTSEAGFRKLLLGLFLISGVLLLL